MTHIYLKKNIKLTSYKCFESFRNKFYVTQYRQKTWKSKQRTKITSILWTIL